MEWKKKVKKEFIKPLHITWLFNEYVCNVESVAGFDIVYKAHLQIYPYTPSI